MNVLELVCTTDPKLSVFACGQCRSISRTGKEGAEKCCTPRACETCGQPTGEHWREKCAECDRKAREARDQATFDKAKKVPAKEYSGKLYCDHCERFYDDVEELLDDHFDDAPPEWAWGCEERAFSMRASDVLDGQLESQEWFEDAHEYSGNLDDLQAALDKVAATIPHCFWADHGTVVTFEAETEEYVRKHSDPGEAAS